MALSDRSRSAASSRSLRTPESRTKAEPPTHRGFGPAGAGRAVTRYDIEIRPAFLTVPAGHRLRIMLRTGNATHPSWIDLQVG